MSTDTHSIQKLQEAFTSIPVGACGVDCPDPDRLWAAVRLKLPAEERRDIVRHTAVCSACAEDWRVSWALWKKEQDSDSNGSGGEVLNGPWRTVKKVLPQVAAAGLVVLAVGVGGALLHQTSESGFRGTTTDSQFHFQESLSRNDFTLEWPDVPGASFTIRVLSEDGNLLAKDSQITRTNFTVPPQAFSGLSPGDPVFWEVEARGPDGVLATFGPVTTTLR